MKFGKRLSQEAARRWTAQYIDYKRLKRAIKSDLENSDARGTTFTQTLAEELAKVSKFYGDKERELESTFESLENSSSVPEGSIIQFLHEAQELQKFVALNYLAVIKASKKCNRHLKEISSEFVPHVQHHLDLLSTEVFFTSPRLANLSTRAEILASGSLSERLTQDPLQDYQCPICLDVLRNPVVLTCAHRFCWGCLLGHCTTSFHRSAGNSVTTAVDVKRSIIKAAALEGAIQEKKKQHLASEQTEQQPTFYDCPVCRKPQVLDVDVLHTDVQLSDFIEGVRKKQQAAPGTISVSSPESVGSLALECPPASCEAADSSKSASYLLPPQNIRHKGQMTVLLDLDGTLVSSFSPKRAPQLPSSVRTHHVGQGSQLNPHGVFVVERPGLQEFLETVSQFSEVVIFTAGLEDYAHPIIKALDPSGKYFSACIFREGTVKTSYYQCVKDMAHVGRDLGRTVLVDDTALAFLHQPDNGIPVQQFRGEASDKLLLDALLPFLQELRAVPDVRQVLNSRFSMGSWFKRHGYPIDTILEQAADQLPQCIASVNISVDCTQSADISKSTPAPAVSTAATVSSADVMQTTRKVMKPLLLMDFDHTLTNWDAGERLMEDLAPELLPMLRTLQMPSNFIPITNTLLGELQRRGVSRDKLLLALRNQAKDLPSSSSALLRFASQQGVDVKVVSDCNSVFISQILSGAKVSNLVSEVITNPSSFQRAASDSSEAAVPAMGALGAGVKASVTKASSHQLVISPCHPTSHCCPRCPENFCKGAEVVRLRASGKYSRIIYCGDGANDICPALAMTPQDVVLARNGFSLQKYLRAAAEGNRQQAAKATVSYWDDHEELLRLVKGLLI